MQDSVPTADAFLDAAGEACGTLTPLIRQALLPMAPGAILEVQAHDAAARAGVPAWCRLTGHELLHAQAEGESDTRFHIRKTPHRS